jgi:predicted Zn-dependent protease
LAASSSQAYAYNGCRWGGTTIYWKYISGSPSSYNTLILDAANSWNPDNVNMVRTSTSASPNIQVGAFNYGNVSWSGHTNWTCASGFFNHPVVIDINRYYTDHYVSQKTQGTIAHEFGHSLGLAHYSTSSSRSTSSATRVS